MGTVRVINIIVVEKWKIVLVIFYRPNFIIQKKYCRLQVSDVAMIYRGCVCVFSSHSFWTSSSLGVPAGVTQEEGHTGFFIHLPYAVRALIFRARRIRPFLSLVDDEVEFLCTNDLIVLHSLGIFFFFFLVRKSQRVRRLRGSSCFTKYSIALHTFTINYLQIGSCVARPSTIENRADTNSSSASTELSVVPVHQIKLLY